MKYRDKIRQELAEYLKLEENPDIVFFIQSIAVQLAEESWNEAFPNRFTEESMNSFEEFIISRDIK